MTEEEKKKKYKEKLKKKQEEKAKLELEEALEDDENEAGGFKFKLNFHVVFISIILILLVVSLVKLFIWNVGHKSTYDPNEDTSEFDVEVLDNIIPLDPERLEGHEDDGELSILFLGNNPLSEERESENGICNLVASMTGAKVYNAGIPYSRVATVYSSFNDAYPWDYFALPYVTDAITNNWYDGIENAATYEVDSAFTDAIEQMKSVDYDNLDAIVIFYDGYDYVMGSHADNPDNPYELSTYTGGLRNAIEDLQEAWPYVRIYVMSPYYCFALDENNNFMNGSIADLGNGTLSHYLQLQLDVCMDYGVSFIDNYYGTINEDNYHDYLYDYIHLTDEGRRLVASRISRVIGLAPGVEK